MNSQQNQSNSKHNQSYISEAHSVSSKGQGGQHAPVQSRRHLSQSTNKYLSQNQTNNYTSINETQSVSSIHQDQQQEVTIYGTNVNPEEVAVQFKDFLLNFESQVENIQISQNSQNQQPTQMVEENVLHKIYLEKLRQIKESDNFILQIEGDQIFQFKQNLYMRLIFFPSDVIPIMDSVAQQVFREQFCETEQDFENASRILVGIVNLRKQTVMRELNPKDLNHLIQIKGIIIRCSEIYPEMRAAVFRCSICGDIQQVQLIQGNINEPKKCNRCKRDHVYQLQHNQSQFTDKQYVKIQETPESVPEGETPQSTILVAYDDNVDSVKPGDRIDCIGVYRAQSIRQNKNRRMLKTVYNTYIDVISYQKINKNRFMMMDEQQIAFSVETRNKLQKLSKNENIGKILVNSLAPSIWENEDVKKGILCQLFGGTDKQLSESGKGRFRKEINCLLVGDPSVAKSQMLQYVYKLAPRGIYTSGKGSSAVGLTAYITKDPDTKDIVLESGALVLSDLGICCIDEFDKMDDKTRSILHEAMEQQTISIAKQGVVAQLNARTAILAAANPLKSRYDPKKSVIENINLPPTLLSRFDLIYILLDQAMPQKDRNLAKHILSLYTKKSQSEIMEVESNQALTLDRETLAQYISYARQEVKPKLTDKAQQLLVKGYVEMRQLGSSKKVITCTPRQLESAIRLSEAHAKMRLKDFVEEEDVEEAWRLIKVATQQAATDPTTGLIDMDMLATGKTAVSRQKINVMVGFIQDIINANIDVFKNQGMQFQQLREQIMQKFGTKESDHIEDTEVLESLRILEEGGQIIIHGHWKKPTLIKSANL